MCKPRAPSSWGSGPQLHPTHTISATRGRKILPHHGCSFQVSSDPCQYQGPALAAASAVCGWTRKGLFCCGTNTLELPPQGDLPASLPASISAFRQRVRTPFLLCLAPPPQQQWLAPLLGSAGGGVFSLNYFIILNVFLLFQMFWLFYVCCFGEPDWAEKAV